MPLTQTLLLAGAVVAPLGIVVALVVHPIAGGLAVVGGSCAALLGLHRLGRAGMDSAMKPAMNPAASSVVNSGADKP